MQHDMQRFVNPLPPTHIPPPIQSVKDKKLTLQTDNSTEYCGAGQRLNLYEKDDAGTTTTSLPTTSIPASTAIVSRDTTTTSESPSPTGPSIDETIGDWEFQGCYTEATDMRALSGSTYAQDNMTLDSCAEFCDGFKYFGTEYGRECRLLMLDLKAGDNGLLVANKWVPRLLRQRAQHWKRKGREPGRL